jgi:hypothetical protein
MSKDKNAIFFTAWGGAYFYISVVNKVILIILGRFTKYIVLIRTCYFMVPGVALRRRIFIFYISITNEAILTFTILG